MKYLLLLPILLLSCGKSADSNTSVDSVSFFKQKYYQALYEKKVYQSKVDSLNTLKDYLEEKNRLCSEAKLKMLEDLDKYRGKICF